MDVTQSLVEEGELFGSGRGDNSGEYSDSMRLLPGGLYNVDERYAGRAAFRSTL